ncbi:phospholipase D family protein [Sabulicella glaciei]|uniref:Phospholipase D n=1 Tax=Sabulicella glaciei TaxID=2984948 RepID=A0ABT3NTF9_9PROT|nr:phospholipase D family protein [Roseococcus sp. MDT2-1-1]MCW8085441.1 phospholipase D family protein [Roseococcus sp. MDT2-1-1]
MARPAPLPDTCTAEPVPGRTHVSVLRTGLMAFAARVKAARGAEKRLDLLYYIWRNDLTGRLLAREVLRVAERGVRVRMLLDDMYAIGRERHLAALDAHPMIEVRLFNATRWRRLGVLGLLLEMLLGGWHLNRRMHNKAWLVDGCVAICGGRNIGDEYFDAGGQFNFSDLDLAMAGPAAAQAQHVFERYWNHELARKVTSVTQAPFRLRGGLRGLAARLDAACALPAAKPYYDELAADPEVARVLSDAEERVGALVGGNAIQVVADPPEKALGRAGEEECVSHGILDLLRGARKEALLISPYFVPGEEGALVLEGLARQGVRISVITNSLAATDVVAVHGGYSRYRARLLRAGIALHELKASGAAGVSVFGSRGASLHTKAVLVDGERAFVGSFNLDPRSIALNTEMGVMIRHPDVARELHAEHGRLAGPAWSWTVTLDEAEHLVWSSEQDDAPVHLRKEPGASLRRRFLAGLVRLLPVESQL